MGELDGVGGHTRGRLGQYDDIPRGEQDAGARCGVVAMRFGNFQYPSNLLDL